MRSLLLEQAARAVDSGQALLSDDLCSRKNILVFDCRKSSVLTLKAPLVIDCDVSKLRLFQLLHDDSEPSFLLTVTVLTECDTCSVSDM